VGGKTGRRKHEVIDIGGSLTQLKAELETGLETKADTTNFKHHSIWKLTLEGKDPSLQLDLRC
jgi:hypothetical protein